MEIREITDFKGNLEEGVKTKTVGFSTPLIIGNEINKNKRKYSVEILQKAAEEFQLKIEKGRGYGTQDHPLGDAKLKDVSHRLTKVYMKNGTLHVEGLILADTDEGKKILSMIKSGGSVGVSARGFGTMTQGKDGINVINSDYKMAGADFVLNPSVDIAQVNQDNIFESMEIVEEKDPKVNEISAIEFSQMVDEQLRHQFELRKEGLNWNEENVQKSFEKYSDEHWGKMAEKVEGLLKKSGKIVEESTIKKSAPTAEMKINWLYEEYKMGLADYQKPMSFDEFKESIKKEN